MKKFISLLSRFFMIIATSVFSFTLIAMIIIIISSLAAVIYAVEFIQTTSEFSLPESEKVISSYIYIINNNTNEYDIIYKATPDTKNIQIDISADNLPEYVKLAFVCTEDKRFYSHEGVDIQTTAVACVKEICRYTGLSSPDMTGGSTITQQLVKNITSDNEISVQRKLREIFRAVSIEKNYSKDQILEKYLNIIYFGQTSDGYNMYGIEAAAIGYFGKSACELTVAEAASLAAIPQQPSDKNPYADYDANCQRKLYCLRRMFESGVISPQIYEDAVAEKIIIAGTDDFKTIHPDFKHPSDYVSDFENPEPTTWIIDTAISEFCEYMTASENVDYDEALNRFMNGGYEIYLTTDNEIQSYLEEKYSDYTYFPERTASYTDSDGHPVEEKIQSAIVVMDYKGNIKGIVGRIGPKTTLGWNNAINAHRQPGSTIKPLTAYGYALENDFITWSSFYYDTPLPAGTVQEGEWPNNYNGSFTGKRMAVHELLRDSYNTTPAQICAELGLENIFSFAARNLRLQLDPQNDMTFASLSIGALSTGPNLINLTNAYMPYGNGGMYYKAHIIKRIKDASSPHIYLENDMYGGTRAVSEETAYIMNKLLREVITDGTGKQALLTNKKNAGKTGTTENFRDIMFVALTEDFVSALWLGYENGENPDAIRNASSSEIWKNVFGNFADEYKSDASFPECSTVINSPYCAETGLIASKNCPVGGNGYYKSTNCKVCDNSHKQKK